MTIKENLVDPQRWNRYAYVSNNPIRFLDPDGRMQRDSNGNLIFKPVGDPRVAQHPSGERSTMQGGYLIADDGTKVAAARIPYNPVSTNSNAYATGAAKSLGLTVPKPPVWAPGRDTKLPVTLLLAPPKAQ
jgi:hypothetical protein